jgi:hypothetical protein
MMTTPLYTFQELELMISALTYAAARRESMARSNKLSTFAQARHERAAVQMRTLRGRLMMQIAIGKTKLKAKP